MNKLLRYLIPDFDEHLTDDRLAGLVCGELSFTARWLARRHLAQCWQCRLRKENLAGPRAKRMLDLDRKFLNREALPETARAEFSQRLRLHLQQADSAKGKRHRLPRIPIMRIPAMTPTLATSALVAAAVFGFAAIFSLSVWWQQRTPQIKSNALLVRAGRWDTTRVASAPGVVYQSVRITLSKQSKKESVSRTIYRDAQGRRQPKQVKLSTSEEELKGMLVEAGLDWNDPLAASGYQNWHDQQHEREDHVERAGSHLLKLTTTAPRGIVAEQSLTVRETDFHPVERTVAFRDARTVEIAELDYKVLPWAAVDANLFEPFGGSLRTASDGSGRIIPFPLPATVSDMQLDEAELSARLVLNQLHADTGEQIEIHRRPQEIEVTGVVGDDERKRQLQTQLYTVPHVIVTLQSTNDLKKTAARDAPTSLQVASLPEQRPPLAIYLEAHGRSISESNRFARDLFSTALTISQETKAIADLQKRLGAASHQSVYASATLAELIYNHRERMASALRQERQLLIELQAGRESAVARPEARSLSDAADKNLALAKELTESDQTANRSAERTLAEMFRVVEDLKDAAHRVYTTAQGNTTLSGKK